MSAGTIAVPGALDLRSFTLPDIKGKVKSKFRKPPKPPWPVVRAFLWVVWGLLWGTYDLLHIVGVLPMDAAPPLYYGMLTFWLLFEFCQVRTFLHEYVKWTNEWRDKPRRVPSLPSLYWWLAMLCAWLCTLPFAFT